ncbi:YfjI family protein [Pseudomonas sp. TWR3-1-1]|uniref:YfjI family protein n=1 Tax=Pseudomonas sp. TWR3-1-1 TaxID=2804633 RepID=UPI003CFAB212
MLRIERSCLPRINADFPRLSPFPLVNAVLDELERNTKAPRPLLMFGLMTALSVSIQGLFDVRKPNGQRVPISLLLLTVAESGERKSFTAEKFLAPIRLFQKKQESIWQEQLSEWKVKEKIWLIKNKEIEKKIKSLCCKQESTAEVELELMKHTKDRPARPRQFKMLYDDSTSEALFCGLYENLSTAGIISSEGGLKGRAFNDLPKQNAMWSGDPIVVDRKVAESYQLYGARLTFSVMTQPVAFKAYMKARGDDARGSGLWARFLVCHPSSTRGKRLLDDTTLSYEHIHRYAERIEQLLKCNLDLLSDPCKERAEIVFSPAASKLWVEVFNEIESGIAENGRFDKAADLASKLADNIARVAALFHVFEANEGGISLEALVFSVDLCLWCSDEFFHLFMPASEVELDVIQLEKWLRQKRVEGYSWVKRNTIMQYGPRTLRSKKRLDACLDEMALQDLVSFSEVRNASIVEF